MIVVVKIGTSSLTNESGCIDKSMIAKLCADVATVRKANHDVIIVTSGAVAAGLPAFGYSDSRPRDTITLQAAAAVGQSRLMSVYNHALEELNLVGGQILLTPNDFFDRRQYLHARETLARLLQLGIVPILNENDAIAEGEVRFGDNDRIAALVANSVGAELLVLLTDTPGVYTADPRLDVHASLIEEVTEIDKELMSVAGGVGSARGSGGMASKVAAARMASWSGVRTVIAASKRENVLVDAVAGESGVGTVVHARNVHLTARKVWIAFAVAARGRVMVDNGAKAALINDGSSLLPAGVIDVEGSFDADTGVEVVDESGVVFAKGLSRHTASQLREYQGSQTTDLPFEVPRQVIHRDDLVVLVEAFSHP